MVNKKLPHFVVPDMNYQPHYLDNEDLLQVIMKKL